MLALDQRSLLFSALQPPAGYRFDCGVGTTFTLDLEALMITPLSLALLDHAAEDALEDPVLLLEALRRYAGRLTIFCDAGHMAVPRKYSLLYRYLEESVVEVRAPYGGVFHPKVWLVRYTAQDSPPYYRLLCLSRNLTFDKSWDLIVKLDGELSGRQLAYGRNNPLGDFIESLPGLAHQPVPTKVRKRIDLLQHEVRRVAFESPPGFLGDPEFRPMGIRGYLRSDKFNDRSTKSLIISPFLTDDLLNRIAGNQNGSSILVSRLEALDSLRPKTRSLFSELYRLNEALWEPSEEENTPQELEVGVSDLSSAPTGLHAKLFIFDLGWDSRWLVGSANATRPAFLGHRHRNVEFMVGLRGRRSKVGVDKVLGDIEEDASLRAMLSTYYPPTASTSIEQDPLRAEHLAREVRDWLVVTGLQIHARPESAELYMLKIARREQYPDPPEGEFEIRCWPLSLPEARQLLFAISENELTFSNVTVEGLTPFLALEVKARHGAAVHTIRFVLRLPIMGMPEDRDDHLISAIISDRSRFLFYLRLILAEEQEPGINTIWPDVQHKTGTAAQEGGNTEVPLLEELMRALSRSAEKIDRLDRLVSSLRKTERGRSALPVGFESLWASILETRRKMA